MKTLHIPYRISSLDDSSILRLDSNFTEIQNHVVNTEYEIQGLKDFMAEIRQALTQLIGMEDIKDLERFRGPRGYSGSHGPGLVYRGVYDNGETYYYIGGRRDVVYYGGKYYMFNVTLTGGVTVGAFDAGQWAEFGDEFSSIATGLLLAEDAAITKNLHVGGGEGSGFAGMSGVGNLDASIRFWAGKLDRDTAPFRVQNDGSVYATNADISGKITATSGSVVDYIYVGGTKPSSNADHTQTAIDGGVITTGTLQVVQGGSVAAGITGATSSDTAVRFWAGSSYANRALSSTPFRVLQNGTTYTKNLQASGDGTDSLSVGVNTRAYGTNSVTIGRSAVVYAGATDSIAIGSGAFVTSNRTEALSIGTLAYSQSSGSVCIGQQSRAHGTGSSNSVCVGRLSYANNDHVVAIGNAAQGINQYATAVGANASATTRSVSAGRTANASGVQSTAIGSSAEASNENATTLGYNSTAGGQHATALGTTANASGLASVALGYAATAASNWSLVLGHANHNTVVSGDLHVNGNFSVAGTGKGFQITNPANADEDLYHGCVESPTPQNIYRYTVEVKEVKREQEMNLPEWFSLLNTEIQVFISPNKHFGRGYGYVENNKLKYACDEEGEYNLLVIGTRNESGQAKGEHVKPKGLTWDGKPESITETYRDDDGNVATTTWLTDKGKTERTDDHLQDCRVMNKGGNVVDLTPNEIKGKSMKEIVAEAAKKRSNNSIISKD